jgi:uncharacterized protein YneF (UPF0154 family)
MSFGVILLWITAALFVGFGVGFVVAPRKLAKFITGGSPSTPSAIIDMRATYGGVALGLGLFLGLCATRPLWVRPGLIASLLVVASIGAARVVGLVVDGHPNAFMLLLLATEVVFVGLYALALR